MSLTPSHRSLLALVVLSLCACASPDAARSQPAGGAPSAYFPVDQFHPDRILPGPPAPDSVAGAADLAVVRALVAGSSAERRAVAMQDADLDVSVSFAAPLGRRLNAETVPLTAALMQRAFVDGARLFTATKAPFGRLRPFLADPAIAWCWPEKREAFARSLSYPSGDAAWGWATALILTQMVPERSEALLARGREIGDSRVVCGVHFPSDVEAGRLVGAAFVARLQAEPAFLRDLASARRELRAALGLPNSRSQVESRP